MNKEQLNNRRPHPVPSETQKLVTVCFCGSSKWPELHHRLMMQETLAGRIVIPMGLYGHADYPAGAKAATNDGDESTAVKQMLDTLHHRKIDLADEILVISQGGYIGSSTKREIEYATKTGKKVRYHDEPATQATATQKPMGVGAVRGATLGCPISLPCSSCGKLVLPLTEGKLREDGLIEATPESTAAKAT